ncbi:histidine kinase [Lentzea chajnantorensis]
MGEGAPVTVLDAVTGRGFLLGGWPWRSLWYLVTNLPVALVAGAPLALVVLLWQPIATKGPSPAAVLSAALGVLAATVVPVLATQLAKVERARVRLVDTRPITTGDRAAGLHRYGEAAMWREVAHTCLLATVVPVVSSAFFVLFLLVVAFALMPALVVDGPVAVLFWEVGTAAEAWACTAVGLAGLVALTYLAAGITGVQAQLARELLGGRGDLRAELVEVSASRARLVDAFEAERRRIERDLHDGAQQRLVSLTIQLGLARVDLPGNENVAAAHEQAKELMAELRELIRDIHPQVLTDHGLAAALDDLADRMPLPVTVSADLTRLPAAVESAAYFVVSEALTNVAKHAQATEAQVQARQEGSALVVEVVDNGHGGADPAGGTGLTGLADRVAVVGGRMLLSSPTGGPTRLRVEIPCRSE